MLQSVLRLLAAAAAMEMTLSGLPLVLSAVHRCDVARLVRSLLNFLAEALAAVQLASHRLLLGSKHAECRLCWHASI